MRGHNLSVELHWQKSSTARYGQGREEAAARTFLAQYMRMKPCILPWWTISSCAAFHSRSCVLPSSNSSLRAHVIFIIVSTTRFCCQEARRICRQAAC